MKCFWCLVAYQSHEVETVSDAEYVYNGKSCCISHVNTERGWPAGMIRHQIEEES